MKIDKIEIYPITIDRTEVFRIATGSALTAENVLVKITSGDKVGWGNGTPNSVTKETTESILKALNLMRKRLEGREIEIASLWDELKSDFPDSPSAVAGIDIALHDLKGKMEEKPVFELYGGRDYGVLTDRTIGIMTYNDTVDHALHFVQQGFKAIKIKIGLDIMDDIRRIQAVRNEVGPDIKIWIDANQGYTVQEAITLCRKIDQFDIEFVEQPVRVDDLEGLKRVTRESDIPIMADESVKGPGSAEIICSEEMADMVNIKLMKCGGITGGRRIIEVIEGYGVDAMVGCMGEVSMSIAAGTHIHRTSHNIKYADLDSPFMLSDNIASGLEFSEGRLWTNGDGLGVDVIPDIIKKYSMDMEAVV